MKRSRTLVNPLLRLGHVVSLLFSILHCQAGEQDAFRHLNNALGFADRQGNCAVWWFFDHEIKLSEGRALPLRMQFNSNPRYSADSCLGHGWWFPILESTVVQNDEGTVVMNGPGGYPFYFLRDPGKPGAFLTQDLKYKGQQTDSGFDVEGEDGWKFHYHLGRLRRAQTPQGDELTWRYDKNCVVGITSRADGDLLRAQYDSANGLLKSLAGKQGEPSLSFTYGQVPLVVASPVGNTISNVLPTLGGVKDQEGLGGSFTISPAEDLAQLKLSLDYRTKDLRRHLEQYAWSTQTKAILQDNFGTYQVAGQNQKDSHAQITRLNTDGSLEKYSFDSKTGILEAQERSGIRFRKYMTFTPGASYGRTRKIETAPGADQPFVTSYQAVYGSHAILRETETSLGGYSAQFDYDDQGQVAKITPRSEGLKVIQRDKEWGFYDAITKQLLGVYDLRKNLVVTLGGDGTVARTGAPQKEKAIVWPVFYEAREESRTVSVSALDLLKASSRHSN